MKPNPLSRQISLYILWKRLRSPVQARIHKVVLLEFFDHAHIKCASKITFKHIQTFAEAKNGLYQKQKAISVLRQFFRYWIMMGVLEKKMMKLVQYDTIPEMAVGRKVHTDQVAKVRELREKGMTFREIQAILKVRDKRTYDLHALHRWANYKLPEVVV